VPLGIWRDAKEKRVLQLLAGAPQRGLLQPRPRALMTPIRVGRPMADKGSSAGTTDLAAGWSVAPGRSVLLASARSPNCQLGAA